MHALRYMEILIFSAINKLVLKNICFHLQKIMRLAQSVRNLIPKFLKLKTEK